MGVLTDIVNEDVIDNVVANKKDYCRLFLFEPRVIYNKCRRPLIYNFTEGFTQEVLRRVNDGDISSLPSISECSMTSSAVIPNSRGKNVHLDVFSDQWTFMLIVSGRCVSALKKKLDSQDKKESYDDIIVVPNNDIYNNTMVIYIGYFEEEPVAYHTIDYTTPTFNESVYLNITKKTVFKLRNVRPNSSRIRPDINPIITNCSIVEHRHDVYQDEDPYDIRVSTRGLINNNSDPYFTDDIDDDKLYEGIKLLKPSLQSPKKHIKSILKTISENVSNIVYDCDTSDSIFTKDIFIENLALNHSMEENPTFQSAVYNIGFNEDDILPLSYIIDTLDPHIVVVKYNQTGMDRRINIVTDDESNTSPESVFTTMMENVIPDYLITWNLSDVAFSYDSYSNKLDVDIFTSIDECSQSDLERRFDAFIYEIQRDVFSMLRNLCGDFSCHIRCNVFTDTMINLIFNDYHQRYRDEYTKASNVFEPFASNLICTKKEKDINRQSIDTFANIIGDCIDVI